jgi:glucose-1-phosphate adenylyltransferase
MIDFSLSNCVNSGIDTVGVLVQYKPTKLNRYLGTGAAWDLDAAWGGVHILPPYATQTGGEWYEGTADAIYHNIDYIDEYDPEYVVILSGDHLYQMDYNLMLDYHKLMSADLTVAVKTVPWEDASRFGLMVVDDEMHITKFTEKPKNPQSNLASMGIYIFTWKPLREALLKDHMDPDSEKDFGKNIIPAMLADGKNLYAYVFSGFWADVGTIPSYYNTQMDLLNDEPEFKLHDTRMRILSNINEHPPTFIGEEGHVEHSMVCNGCEILGKVYNSILSPGVTVEKGAVVRDCILLPDSTVGEGAVIERTILDEKAAVASGAKLGGAGKITVVGESDTMVVEE